MRLGVQGCEQQRPPQPLIKGTIASHFVADPFLSSCPEQPHAGGRCRSYFDAVLGMRIDNGNHIVLSGNHATLAYLECIGAGEALRGPDHAVFDFIDLAANERWRLMPDDGPIPWWIFDAQFSIISWSLRHLGLIDHNINFLGDSWNARMCVIFANIWRGVPFVAITLLAGLQTVSPSLYEAATLDGATRWQMFRHITYPLLTPIIAVVMTFSVLFTFTDFQLIWAMTRGGPVNATHLMATLSYQRAILGGNLGEGAAISTAMVPFLLAAIMVSWFGLQRRKWQQGEGND